MVIKIAQSIALIFFMTLTVSHGQEVDGDPQTSPYENGVLIFGATRNTGYEVAKILTGQGVAITAFVRPTSDRTAVDALGVAFAEGDAMDAASVNAAFKSGTYDAVITTVGCNLCDNPPDLVGNRNVFDAAKKAGVQRVIYVSSIGAGDSHDALPWFARLVLGKQLKLKTLAEDHLRASDLDYTIIRPGNLKDGEVTGTGSLSEDPSTGGVIRRSDLARLIVDALYDDATIEKVYAAVGEDP